VNLGFNNGMCLKKSGRGRGDGEVSLGGYKGE
jgi:hypothetical protein